MLRRNQRGFTLVELMVVIVLIGLLATVVTVKVIPMILKGKNTTAKAQLSTFKEAIELYHLNVGTYPETLDDLTQTSPNGDEPLLEEIPLDPWNEEYIYEPTGGDPYLLLSKGEDKMEGTEDDITPKSRKDE